MSSLAKLRAIQERARAARAPPALVSLNNSPPLFLQYDPALYPLSSSDTLSEVDVMGRSSSPFLPGNEETAPSLST